MTDSELTRRHMMCSLGLKKVSTVFQKGHINPPGMFWLSRKAFHQLKQIPWHVYSVYASCSMTYQALKMSPPTENLMYIVHCIQSSNYTIVITHLAYILKEHLKTL